MTDNIYTKINIVKQKILEANLKKSGKNKFAGFEYYELADILPTIVKLCNEFKLFTYIKYEEDYAILTIVNAENDNERIEITSPMKNLELKGCNEIQALGGVETYQRRYLLMTAFDIVENDMFDGLDGENDNNKQKAPQLITQEQINQIEDLEIDKIKLCQWAGVDNINKITYYKAKQVIDKKNNNN